MSETAPVRVPTRMTTDYVTATVEVEFSDGQVVRKPMSTSEKDTGRQVVRSDYDPATRELRITFAWGAQATADIGGGGTDAERDGRPVVYLDQNHWVALARHQWAPEKVPKRQQDAYARLYAMARDRKIIVPLSAAHLVETAHSDGRWRRDLATTMLQLSRGWQMRNPLNVRHEELVTGMSAGRRIEAPPVFSLTPRALFENDGRGAASNDVSSGLPIGLRDFHRRLTWASVLAAVFVEDEIDDSPDAADKVERWRSAYERLAKYMGDVNMPAPHRRLNSRASLLADLKLEFARAALTVGFSPKTFEEWMDDSEKRIGQMPYLGRLQEVVHQRLRNAQEQWHANDLNDMHFLSCAAGYADVVIGENHFSNHIRQASKQMESGAFVSASPVEAVGRLESMARASAKLRP